MVRYKLTSDGVQNTETTGFIPASPANRDWQKYQEWLKVKGNKPDPEFTEEEKVDKKEAKIKQLKTAIVDMRLRKDTAKTEGFTEIEAESQTELDELRAELIAEQVEV